MSVHFLGTRRGVIFFYKEQLAKFKKIGMNRRTEWGTVVTPQLVNATKRRIEQLGGKVALHPLWETIATPRMKEQKLKHLEQELIKNGQLLPSTNGTTATKTCKVDSNTRNGKGGT